MGKPKADGGLLKKIKDARHRVPALNLLIRSLLGLVPHDEAPDRGPFKES